MEHEPRDFEALIAHLEELTEEYDEDHTPEFLSQLTHDAPEVRAVAVRGLWESDPMEVLEPLWRVAEHDVDPEVRATALSVMGRYIYEGLLLGDREDPFTESPLDPETIDRVRGFLEKILFDEQQDVLMRRRALEALAFDPGPEDVALIERWAQDSSSGLRMTAVFAMGRAGLDNFEPLILQALDDSAYEVRREAVRGIGEAGIEKGLPRLELLIQGSDREMQLEAISALGLVGGDRAIELLSELVESEDAEIAELAEAALEAAEEVSYEEGFLENLDDENV